MADKPLRVVQLGVVPAVPAPAPAQEIAPDGYERPRRVHTGGSPKAEIDIDLLRRCHEVRMTVEEAAAFQHVSLRTLQRYLRKKEYRDAWEEGENGGRASLKMLQFRQAHTDVRMSIHLGKHWLGQIDKVHHSGDAGGPVIFNVTNVDLKLG